MFSSGSTTVYELVQPNGSKEVSVSMDPRTWTVYIGGIKYLLAVDEDMRRSVLENIGLYFDRNDLDSLDFGAAAGIPAATPARKQALMARFKTDTRKSGMQLGGEECAAFLGDADVVRAAMQTPGCHPEDEIWKAGGPFKFADESLRADCSFVLEMARLNGCVLQHADPALRDDREIATAAVTSAPRALQWLGPKARTDVSFLMEHFVKRGRLREIGKFGDPHLLSLEQVLEHAPRDTLDEVTRYNEWPLEMCTGVAKAMGTYVEPTRRVVCGEWVSPHLAGGCPNHVTWRDNPQYVLSLSRNLAVFAPSFTLTITQSDLASGAAPQTVGLFVAYGVEAELLREGRPNYACKATPCKTGQPMTLEVNFTPCGGNACYIVVPFTFEPGVEAAFRLEVSSKDDDGFTLTPHVLASAPAAAASEPTAP